LAVDYSEKAGFWRVVKVVEDMDGNDK